VDPTSRVIANYRAKGVDAEAVELARLLVSGAAPLRVARARTLLWITSRLVDWALSVGLEPRKEVVLKSSVIERFVSLAMADVSYSARRTARTNLRYMARKVAPELTGPALSPLARSRAKLPYKASEVEAYFALARAQPTEARRQRLTGLLCLGLGAGVQAEDLRYLTGNHLHQSHGALVVVLEGRHPRTVPVLTRYEEKLKASALYAGSGFICGGVSAIRKNLTNRLLDSTSGGSDLSRLDVGRLRATWLCEQLVRLSVPELLCAAGVTHSQRIWDLVATLGVPSESAMIKRLS
jgi:hypothetical protein